MPLEPNQALLEKLLGLQAPVAPNRPINPQPMPPAQSLMPSWMRSGFEGGTDFGLGMMGLGPDTRANQMGQLTMAGIPMFGRLRGLLGMAAPVVEETPSLGGLKKAKEGMKAAYDLEGRFLGNSDTPVDPAYVAHVASSRNKIQPPKPSRASFAPSAEQVERLMGKYAK